MTTKNISWNISQEQIDILSNCKRINDIILVNAKSNTVISIDALDQNFNVIYINEHFDYSLNKEIIVHNLSEILKSIKNINNPIVILGDNKISVTDSDGNIKCNYLYAAEEIVNEIKEIYDIYPTIVDGIKEGNTYVFNFSDNEFNMIKKFTSFGHNTLSITNGKIVLYDNTASNDINLKDNVELNIEKSDNINDDFRLDFDIVSFKKITPGNYTCTLSPDGFGLFEEINGNNIYGIVSNKIL